MKTFEKICATCITAYILSWCIFGTSANTSTPNSVTLEKSKKHFEPDTIPPVSLPDTVMQLIYENGIEHPDIVYAQILLETGHFSSELFKNANNLFGMKQAKVRETTNIGEYKNHAKYASIYDSVKDYKLWQQTYASGMNRSEYLSYLNRVYAEDAKYVNKLKRIIRQNDLALN